MDSNSGRRSRPRRCSRARGHGFVNLADLRLDDRSQTRKLFRSHGVPPVVGTIKKGPILRRSERWGPCASPVCRALHASPPVPGEHAVLPLGMPGQGRSRKGGGVLLRFTVLLQVKCVFPEQTAYTGAQFWQAVLQKESLRRKFDWVYGRLSLPCRSIPRTVAYGLYGECKENYSQ